MNIRTCAVAFTFALAACKPSEQVQQSESMTAESGTTVVQRIAVEQGSGTYASNCMDPGNGYLIRLVKGDDGMTTGEVKAAGKTYSDLLTSYSFMGDATPPDFLIAVLFDEANAPVNTKAEDGPRLEIWKNGGSYYALVNGDKATKLALCPA